MTTLQAWLSAFRLRTLPLALSCIFMGSFLAAAHTPLNNFTNSIFILCVLTTILLQIVSNLANDYGDSIHGADSKDRKGPQRAVQAGLISAQTMKKAILLFAFLAFVSGVSLLWVAIGSNLTLFFACLGIGVLAILAAITYTAGPKPYGYSGLGDISVLLFFGWVGVLGSYFLYAKMMPWEIFLPATSCGVFSVAVLNINNIRDIESDFNAGKYSIPVRLGRKNAVIYHILLLTIGVLTACSYTVICWKHPIQVLFLLAVPLLIRNGMAVYKNTTPQSLDP